MSRAPDALSTGPARTVSPHLGRANPEPGGQIFIDGGEFLIIHSSERTPWHLLAHLVTVGIDAFAHGVEAERSGSQGGPAVSTDRQRDGGRPRFAVGEREHAAVCTGARQRQSGALAAEDMLADGRWQDISWRTKMSSLGSFKYR